MIFQELTGIPGVFSTQIAYISEERRPDGTRLFRLIVSDADGENAQRVAESTQPLMSPAWSPDARRLAYVSFEGGSLRRLRADAAHGHARARLCARRRQQLAGVLAGRPHARADAVARHGQPRHPHARSLDAGVAPAHDGRRDRHGGDAGRPTAAASISSRIAPAARRSIASARRPVRARSASRFEGLYNARPRVSPDGKQIAVVYGENNRYRIGVVNPANGELQSSRNGRLDESPSFAPNGAQIIYATRGRTGAACWRP